MSNSVAIELNHRRYTRWILPSIVFFLYVVVLGQIVWNHYDMAEVHAKNCQRYNSERSRLQLAQGHDSQINSSDQRRLGALKEPCDHAPAY